MRESDTAQNTLRDIDIIAQPPFGSGSPFDPKKRSQFHWRVACLCPLDHSRLKALAVAGSFSEILESIAKSAQVLCVHKQRAMTSLRSHGLVVTIRVPPDIFSSDNRVLCRRQKQTRRTGRKVERDRCHYRSNASGQMPH
jgi:hypothetical protein